MIQLVPQMRILVCTELTDFRKGIDTLSAVCRQQLGEDPFSGTLFLFCNRSKKAIKILVYDGQGFWLCIKRLSKGRIKWWPEAKASQRSYKMRVPELHLLLWNGNPLKSNIAKDWKKISP